MDGVVAGCGCGVEAGEEPEAACEARGCSVSSETSSSLMSASSRSDLCFAGAGGATTGAVTEAGATTGRIGCTLGGVGAGD